MSDTSKTVVLVDDETGQSYEAASDKVPAALKQGFRLQTPDEKKADTDREKYGTGVLPVIGAAALGAARTLTLGGSDAFIGAAEDIRNVDLTSVNRDQGREQTDFRGPVEALREQQRGATTAGELAGFAVPLLGATGALGKAGQTVARVAGAPINALTEAGGAIGAGARSVAQAIPGVSKLASVAGGAADLAAQSAAFQAGQNVSDAVLRDHELNAETLLAHVGSAATLGAGIGAAIPAFAIAGRALADGAAASGIKEIAPVKWVTNKATEAVEKFFDPDRSAALFSGAMSKGELLRDTIKGKRFQSAVHDLREAGFFKGGRLDLDAATGEIVQLEKGALPTQQQAYERLQDLADKAGTTMGELLRAADEAAAGKTTTIWAAEDSVKLGAKIEKWKKTLQIGEGDAERLTQTLTEIEEGINASQGRLQDMHGIRRGLDQRIGGKNWEALKGEEIELVKDIRRTLSDKISQRMEQLGEEGVIAKNTVDRWTQLNKTYRDLKTLEAPLDWAKARAEANVNVGGLRWRDLLATSIGASAFGPLGAIPGIANRALQTEQGLLMRAAIGERMERAGWMSKLRDQAAKQRTSGISLLIDGAAAADGARITAAQVLMGKGSAETDSAFLKVLQASKPVAAKLTTTKNDADWWTDVQGRLSAVLADPERELASLDKRAQNLDSDTRAATVRKQMEVLQYLAAKMPRSPRQNMFAGSFRPDPGTLRDFQRLAAVAADPNQIYALVASGRASRLQIDAIKTLYPSTYVEIQTEVQRQIFQRQQAGKPVSYKAQLRLGQLLGAAVNYSQSPAFREALTAATTQGQAAPPAQDQAGSSGSVRSGGKIDVAGKRSSTMAVANR